MTAWKKRIVELLPTSSKTREVIETRGKYYFVEKEPRVHPDHGMVITLYDEDNYRFTTSVRNIRFPQPDEFKDLQRGYNTPYESSDSLIFY